MAPTTKRRSGRGIAFGLIFFSSSEAPFSGDKYRLVIESTKFADQHDFSSVWIPERHFTKDGWLYPNPAILQAALARETRQIQLRAGSVVIPLHNPLTIAEEWAMVDNLSGGRVGVSFASGWHPNDFALFPENYAQRTEIMYRGIEMVRKLWRGETVQVKGGDGNQIEIRTYPPPIQREIPIWITAAGNPKTFAGAGEIGANLLTHMYNQSVDELAEKIRIYRDARARSGYDPESGLVSVMLHTFIGKDEETVRAQLQGPFTEYLKSASYLVNAIAYSRGQKIDLSSLSEQDLNDYLLFVFDRLVSTKRVLFGTPENCLDFVDQLTAAGVDEIACQMDFGVDSELVLESMPYLHQLKELANRANDTSTYPVPLAMESLSSSHRANGHKNTIPDMTRQENHTHKKQDQQDKKDEQLESIQKRCWEHVSMADFYQTLSKRGIQLGTSFQGIEELSRRDGEALGHIRLSQAVVQETDRYQIHPALLDACFQVLIAALPQKIFNDEEALYLPTGMRSFQEYKHPGEQVWSHAKILASQDKSAEGIEGDVRILDQNGVLLAEAKGLQLQRIGMVTQSTISPSVLAGPVAGTSELDGWLYELQWERVKLPHSDSTPAAPRIWLLFMDDRGVGKQLAESLEQQGDTCISVTTGYRYTADKGKVYQVNPTRPEEISKLLKEVQRHGPLYGILYLWGLDISPLETGDAATLEADQEILTGGALHLMQQLAYQGPGNTAPTRLWIVTRGAQSVIEDEQQLEVAQSPLWGLGKTCAIEHPELWGGLIDLDPSATLSEAGTQLYASIANPQTEDQIAFRHGQSYVARMVRSRTFTPQELRIEHDASYLITGGLWGLGLEVAHWLAKKGAQYLVLMGRTKLPPRAQWNHLQPESRQARQIAGILALERTGAHVHYAVVDVTQEEQLASFFTEFKQQGHPAIRGVIHAASVWQDAQGQSLVRPLVNLTTEALMDVFRPKVIGSWLLHTHLKGQKLDFFVSFSSGASLFGSAAQGNYAAAGEFLDLLAHYQRAQGQSALSIDWGAVSETGFGATTEGKRVHEYWEGHGIQRIAPQQVLAALELLIPQKVARVGVLKLDWKLLQEFYPQITALPLVRQLVDGQQQAKTQAAAAGGSTILTTLMQTTSEARAQILQHYLSTQVAGVLRMTSEALDSSQPLTALGLDSLMAIELKNRLELELAVRIPIVTFLQGPSIVQFTTQLLDQLQAKAEETKETRGEQRSPLPTIVNVDSLGKQDTAQLLSQLDQDVDAPLNQMQTQGAMHQGNENGGKHVETETQTTNGQHRHTETNLDLSPQDAQALLAQIDQLSDEQVDALLGQMAQKEE